MKRPDPSKPLCVLDLSWLRGEKPRPLSNKLNYLVPDVLLGELALSDDPAAGAAMFARWMFLNRGRIYLGRTWNRIAQIELDRDRPIDPIEVVDVVASDRLTRCLDDNDIKAWQCGVSATGRGHAAMSNESKRAEFVLLCESFREFLGPAADNWQKTYSTPESRRGWIQQPQLVLEGALQLFPQYCPAGWKDRLACFPDVYAVGRATRIFAWSTLLCAAGLTKGLANNWDDAQYAFLASYTGLLRTRDRRLQELVQAISPLAVSE